MSDRRGGRMAVVVAALVLWAGGAAAECRVDRVDLRTPEGGAVRFGVEIADTPETRARGLMFRESMPEAHGMLFLFDPPQPVAFWMKNTPLPLDILYFDASGRLLNVAENTVPFSEDTLPSDGDARAVLEINAGLSDRFGLGPGTELRHPGIDAEVAAWPCG